MMSGFVIMDLVRARSEVTTYAAMLAGTGFGAVAARERRTGRGRP